MKPLLVIAAVCIAMVGGSMLGNALPDEGPTKKWQAHLGILIALLSTVPAMMAVFP